MKCILMNKNTEVMTLEYDEPARAFTKIYSKQNMDYVPLYISSFVNEKDDIVRTKLNEWLKDRCIPDNRENLSVLLENLNISCPEELLNKSFILSLSDQYWLKPYESKIEWKDINFFDNDFDSMFFLENSFSISPSRRFKPVYHTPNNTLNGSLPKAWVIENKKRVLAKGTASKEPIVPFQEVLATEICERLNIPKCSYELDVINNRVVSKCDCFVDQNTEFISAQQIYSFINKDYNNDYKLAYNEYINVLEKNGINNVRQKIEDMYILDYLILNEDRHLNNFGIIRDVETLKWKDVAPIFDNGKSLEITYSNNKIEFPYFGYLAGYPVKFQELLTVIENPLRIDLSSLNGVVEKYEEILKEYQAISGLTNEEISSECIALNYQIHSLDKFISEKTNNQLQYNYKNKFYSPSIQINDNFDARINFIDN